MKYLLIFVILSLLCLGACRRDGQSLEQLPTPITPDAYATGIVLTQNAPPLGYESVSFPRIDDGLAELSGWRYEVLLQFDGVFARTTRPANTRTYAEVSYNQVASAKRVIAEISGDLMETNGLYEAVQLGPDIFVVQDGTCLASDGEAALTASNLGAGTLIGGIAHARVVGRKAIINGQNVWLYEFEYSDMKLPNIQLGDDGRILALNGELWVAPQYNAVVRYTVSLEVENARILGNVLPVTGTVLMRYDLYDIGVVPNISVPFGC